MIKIYHSCHDNIEHNFCLTSLTNRHAPPNMEKTLAKIALYMDEHKPNQRQAGRKSMYRISDMLDRGEHLVFNIDTYSGLVEDEGIDQAVEEEDLTVEF